MESGETVNSIGRDPEMPCAQTIRNWATSDIDGFFGRYVRAREIQADVIGEKAFEEAQRPGQDANAARLRFDAARWFAGKMHAGRWGDKQLVGGVEGAPIRVAFDEAEMARQIAFMLAKGMKANAGNS